MAKNLMEKMLLYSQNGKNFLHFEHQVNFWPFPFDLTIFNHKGKNFYCIKEHFWLELNFLKSLNDHFSMKLQWLVNRWSCIKTLKMVFLSLSLQSLLIKVVKNWKRSGLGSKSFKKGQFFDIKVKLSILGIKRVQKS